MNYFVEVQSKFALLSHPKQPFLFPAFFGFIIIFAFQFCFSAFFSALFPAFVQPHHLRLSQPKTRNKKQVEFCLDWFWFWISLVNTLFSGAFLFSFSFLFALSLFWKQRVNTGQTAEIWWKGKTENKKQSCQDKKSWRSAMRLLYSIFGWIVWLFSAALEQSNQD